MKISNKPLVIISLSVFCVLFFSLINNNSAKAGSIGNVTNIKAIEGNNLVFLEWQNPSTVELAGVLIVKSTTPINWIPTDGEVYFNSEQVANNLTVIYYSTGKEFVDKTVTNSIKYYYKIFTFDYDASYSSGSETIGIKPYNDSYKPVSPTFLTLNLYNNSIFLDWTESTSSDVKDYKVICENNNGGQDLTTNTKLSETQFSNYDPSSYYTCQVTAIDYSGNESLPSNQVSTNLDNSSGDILLNAQISNNVNLSWTLSSNKSYTGFILIKSNKQISDYPKSGFNYSINDVLSDSSKIIYIGNQKNFIDNNIELNKKYYYLIYPIVSEKKYGNSSNQIFVYPPNNNSLNLQKNSDLLLSGIPETNKVYLNWNLIESPTYAGTIIVKSNFNISWKPTQNESALVGTKVSNIEIVYNGKPNNYIDTNVMNNSSYHYKAFYYDSNYNYSSGSNEIIVTLPSFVSNNKYKPLILSGEIIDSKVKLSWNGNQRTLLIRSNKNISWIPETGNIYSTSSTIQDDISVLYLGTNNIYIDSNVNDTNAYYYKAFEVTNSLFYSDPSNEIVASPSINTFTNVGNDSNSVFDYQLKGKGYDNSVNLSWKEIQNQSCLISKSNSTINWKPSDGLFYPNKKKLGENIEILYFGKNTSLNDTEVINDNTYYYRIFCANSLMDYSESSQEVSVKPSKIEGQSISDDENDSNNSNNSNNSYTNNNPPIRLVLAGKHLGVMLNWSNDSQKTSIAYNSYYKKNSETSYKRGNQQLIYDLSHTISNLEENVVYDFYVTGIDKNLVESIPSDIKSFSISKDTEPPSYIGAVKAITANKQISMSWNDAIDSNLLGYNIYFNNNIIEGSPFNKYPVTITNVENYKEYTIKITAIDKAGNEGDGIETIVTPPDSNFAFDWDINNYLTNDPEIISEDIDISLDDDGRPVVSWDNDFDPAVIVGFQVYRGENPSKLELMNKNFLLTYPPFTDDSTISQVTYYYQFKSINNNAEVSKTSDIIAMKSKDASNSGPFRDVLGNHTFYNYVEKLRTNKIVQGYDGHIYKPNNYISREEALKIIMESSLIYPIENYTFNNYPDSNKNEWSYKYVQTGSIEGIVKGYEDGSFRGKNNVSRIEFLKMVMNAGNISTESTNSNPFPDVRNDFWGTSYVKSGYEKNIISGYSDGLFRPSQNITRAEASKIVSYIINNR